MNIQFSFSNDLIGLMRWCKWHYIRKCIWDNENVTKCFASVPVSVQSMQRMLVLTQLYLRQCHSGPPMNFHFMNITKLLS